MRKGSSPWWVCLLACCLTPVAGIFVAPRAGAATQELTWDANGNLLETASDPGNAAPVIAGQPRDRLGAVGDSVTLSVVAVGSPTLGYEWRLNGSHLPLASNPSATTDTLVLENLGAGDFGDYSVVVANHVAPVTSQVARVREDANRDGLADEWQSAFFGDPSDDDAAPGADPDGDGVTNREEEEDGTHPADPESRFFRLVITRGHVEVHPRAGRYAPGTVVTLAPLPYGALEFTGWSGDATGAETPLQLTMSKDYALAANYGIFPLGRPAVNPSFTTTAGTRINAFARQPDGKVIVGGAFDAISGLPRRSLARFNGDGTLDETFLPEIVGTVDCIALQADGRILVGGLFQSVGGLPRTNIARLHADGRVDDNFDAGSALGGTAVRAVAVRNSDGAIMAGNGIALRRLAADGATDGGFATGAIAGSIHTFVWQPSGKVVVGGQMTSIGGAPVSRIVRLTEGGAVDGSFAATSTGLIQSMLQRPDGRIFVGVSGMLNGSMIRGLALIDADGTLDPSFQLEAGAHVQTDYPNALYLQSDGKLVVAGPASFGSGDLTYLVRLESSGARDTGFATVGNENASRCVIATDPGDILLGGSFVQIGESERLALALFSGADGALDDEFHHGASTARGAVAAAPLPDGGVLVGGNFDVVNGVICRHLAKLNSDGTLDAGFNSGAARGPSGEVRAIAVQPGGGILIGGSFSHIGVEAIPYLARLDALGVPDAGFASAPNAPVSVIVPEPGGRILIAGGFSQVGGTARNGLARLHADGSLDGGFTPSPQFPDQVRSLLVQPDGNILVGGIFTQINGATQINGKQVRGLARLDGHGALDTSFTPATLNAADVRSLSLLPDGQVLVAGNFTQVDGFFSTSRIARLHAGGTLDLSFNAGNALGSTLAADLAVQPGGHFFVGGSFQSVPVGAFDYLARFGPRGERDSAFPVGAVPDGPVNALRQQVSGSLVAVGTFKSIGADPRLGYARFLQSGVIDTGVVSLSIGGGETPMLSLSLAPVSGNGEIGSVTFEKSTNGYDFTPLGNGLPSGGGTWSLSTADFPAGGWFRAVVTDIRTAQAVSEASGPLGGGPVFDLPARLYGPAFVPFVYDVTVAGNPAGISADDLPGWAADDPDTGFDAGAGVFKIRGTPPVPGVFYPTFTAVNDEGVSTASTELILTGTYDYWSEANFSPAEQADPLLSGPEGDAIGDGIGNLFKYAFGYFPHISPIPYGMPILGTVFHGEQEYLSLTYTYDLTAADVTFTVRVSGDLVHWDSGPGFTIEVSRTGNGDGTETVVVRDNVPISSAGKRFMQLQASLSHSPGS